MEQYLRNSNPLTRSRMDLVSEYDYRLTKESTATGPRSSVTVPNYTDVWNPSLRLNTTSSDGPRLLAIGNQSDNCNPEGKAFYYDCAYPFGNKFEQPYMQWNQFYNRERSVVIPPQSVEQTPVTRLDNVGINVFQRPLSSAASRHQAELITVGLSKKYY